MTQKQKNRLRREGGFTLTEIMVAVFIIGLLSTVVIINVAPMIGQSRETKATIDIQALSNALDQYNFDMYDYPSEREGLEALVEEPDSVPDGARYRQNGYIQKLPADPWGRAYVYKRPGAKSGQAYDLYSFGADGQEGGEEENADIGNWN